LNQIIYYIAKHKREATVVLKLYGKGSMSSP